MSSALGSCRSKPVCMAGNDLCDVLLVPRAIAYMSRVLAMLTRVKINGSIVVPPACRTCGNIDRKRDPKALEGSLERAGIGRHPDSRVERGLASDLRNVRRRYADGRGHRLGNDLVYVPAMSLRHSQMTACMTTDAVVHVRHESSLRRLAVSGARQADSLDDGDYGTEADNRLHYTSWVHLTSRTSVLHLRRGAIQMRASEPNAPQLEYPHPPFRPAILWGPDCCLPCLTVHPRTTRLGVGHGHGPSTSKSYCSRRSRAGCRCYVSMATPVSVIDIAINCVSTLVGRGLLECLT